MRGHNICFYRKIRKIIFEHLKNPSYLELWTIFRISNTSINAPNGGLAPVTETEEVEIPGQDVGAMELDNQCPGAAPPDDEGANIAPDIYTQEGMEGKFCSFYMFVCFVFFNKKCLS